VAKQQVVVIGLGRFGSALAEELVREGHEVLGIDSDHSVVQQMATRLTHVVQVNATDEESLRRLGLADFDAAVVGLTDVLESRILVTLALKRLGVPRVISKARNEVHGEILTRVGADRVIYPERDTGLRLAHGWTSAEITDSLDIVEGYIVSRVEVPEELVGRTVGDALGERRQEVSLLALARGSRVTVYPASQQELQRHDVLVLAGAIEHVEAFFASLHRE